MSNEVKKDEKNYTIVQLHEPLLSQVRQVKKDTGKTIGRIVAECIEAGLAVKKFV